MNTTAKKPLKVLAGLAALLLIGGILYVTNAFIGNPLSALLADKAIKQYVEQNYAALELEVEKSEYGFKTGSYIARTESKTSPDTKFAIYYRRGAIRDDYQEYVLGMLNTLNRLSDEYSAIVQRIVATELHFTDNTSYVLYDIDAAPTSQDILALDMEFNKDLPIPSVVTIQLAGEDYSLAKIAAILEEAHQAFLAKGYIFNKYGFLTEIEGKLLMVLDVTPTAIESGELVTLLENAGNNGANGITVQLSGDR